MKVKIGKKGCNTYVKEGNKKYNPKGVSYTSEVLERLDQIQHPKPARRNKGSKMGKNEKG